MGTSDITPGIIWEIPLSLNSGMGSDVLDAQRYTDIVLLVDSEFDGVVEWYGIHGIVEELSQPVP